MRRPSPLETAALAVASGAEPPAFGEADQEQREGTWRKRLVVARPLAKTALLMHARSVRENGVIIFEKGGTWLRRGGEKTRFPT